jgi:hypothetical protein
MKYVPKTVITLYLGAGLFCGLLFSVSIPELNPAGIGYLTLTWPRVIYCAPEIRGCAPIGPSWVRPYLFSFEEPK